MVPSASFSPEMIVLMREVLEETVAALPVRLRTSTVQAAIASEVLKCAAEGRTSKSDLSASALQEANIHSEWRRSTGRP